VGAAVAREEQRQVVPGDGPLLDEQLAESRLTLALSTQQEVDLHRVQQAEGAGRAAEERPTRGRDLVPQDRIDVVDLQHAGAHGEDPQGHSAPPLLGERQLHRVGSHSSLRYQVFAEPHGASRLPRSSQRTFATVLERFLQVGAKSGPDRPAGRSAMGPERC